MTDATVREKLVQSLRESATRNPSAEELQRQRLSYVMGSLKPENNMSREKVSQILARQEGR